MVYKWCKHHKEWDISIDEMKQYFPENKRLAEAYQKKVKDQTRRKSRAEERGTLAERYRGTNEDSNRCPMCSILFFKLDDGTCNKMTCRVCGYRFCLLCARRVGAYKGEPRKGFCNTTCE